MCWRKLSDTSTETWHNDHSGFSIYKGVGDWWFIIPRGWPNNTIQQFGPYDTQDDAIVWSTRLADADVLKEHIAAHEHRLQNTPL